jgi:hypothetical protein
VLVPVVVSVGVPVVVSVVVFVGVPVLVVVTVSVLIPPPPPPSLPPPQLASPKAAKIVAQKTKLKFFLNMTIPPCSSLKSENPTAALRDG